MTVVSGALTSIRRVDPGVLGWALVGCGLLAAVVPYLGVGLAAVALGIPLAVGAVVVLTARPAAALMIMVVVEVTNAANVLETVVPRLFHGSLLLGILTVVRTLVTDPGGRRAVLRFLPIAAGLLACLLLGQVLAGTVSEKPDVSAEVLARNAVDVLFMIVITALCILVRRPWLVAAAIAASFAVLCVLGVVNQVVFDGGATFGGFATVTTASGELITTPRQGGPLPDSNFWGRHLVIGLPPAAALLTRAAARRRPWAAAGWAGALVSILSGVYLTQSRGTFVAAAVALVVWMVAAGPTVRRRALPALLVVFPALALPGVGDRFLALFGDLADRSAGYAADPSVLGRAAAQEIAWMMFRDKPILGVGPGAYTDLVPRYAGAAATAVLQPTDAPHNLYLQLAAETGVVGLAAWLLMFGGFMALTAWSVRRFANASTDGFAENRVLAAAALAGLVAWAVASVFLHLAFFRTLGVLFALVVVLAAEAGDAPHASGRAAGRLRKVLPALPVAAAVGAGAIALTLGQTGQTVVTASQVMTLAPAPDPDGYSAYAYDVRSRIHVLPTFAALAVAPDRGPATAVPDPVRGTLRVTATGGDDGTAARLLDATLAEAAERVRSSGADRSYTLAAVGTPEVAPVVHRSAGEWAAVVGAGTGAAALVLIGFTAVRGRRQ